MSWFEQFGEETPRTPSAIEREEEAFMKNPTVRKISVISAGLIMSGVLVIILLVLYKIGDWILGL